MRRRYMATKHDIDGIGDALEDLFAVLLERKKPMQDESYVSLLYKKGEDSILKKIGEEAAEVIIASKGQDKKELIHEMADLWFHCMVLMGHKGISLKELADEFSRRMGVSGIAEKASRKDH
jgi:phosphoribosyl-ATP pyrophosphohydrolase